MPHAIETVRSQLLAHVAAMAAIYSPSIAPQDPGFESGDDEGSSRAKRMGRTTQHLQTSVHRQASLLSLTPNILEQNAGIIDIEDYTFGAVTVQLNDNRPLKSA